MASEFIGSRVGIAYVTLTLDKSGLEKGFTEAIAASRTFAGKMQATGAALQGLGTQLTKYVSFPLAAIGAASVKLASDFDTAMTRVVSLSGIPAQQLDYYRKKVLAISHDTGIAATDLADTLYYVASAGLKLNQVLPVLDYSARAAATGFGDAADVGSILTSVLNAWSKEGITATQVMNTLTAAIRAGKAEPAEFATTLGNVIPVAAQVGVTFDQVTAAIAAATNVGVTPARAVTGLRYLLTSLSAPTDKAITTMKEYGLTVQDIATSLQQPQGLLLTLKMLADTLDLSTVKGRQAWNAIIGGVRGTIVANTIVGQNFSKVADIFDKTSSAIQGTGDNFDKLAYKLQKTTPGFQFRQLWNDIKLVGIQIGETLLPAVIDAVAFLRKLVSGFESLSPAMQDIISKGFLIGIALGPGLKILGMLVSGWGRLIGFMGKLGGAAAGAGAGMAGPLEAASASLTTAGGALDVSAGALGTSAAALEAAAAALGLAARTVPTVGAMEQLIGQGASKIAGQAPIVGPSYFLGGAEQATTATVGDTIIARNAAARVAGNARIPTFNPVQYGAMMAGNPVAAGTQLTIQEAERAAYAAQGEATRMMQASVTYAENLAYQAEAEAGATARAAALAAESSAKRAAIIRTVGLSAPGGLTATGELAAGELTAEGAAAGGAVAGGGVLSSLGSGLASTGIGAALTALVVGFGGGLSRLKDEWHKSFESMSIDTGLTVEQLQALQDQFDSSAAGFNPFKSFTDFSNEAGQRYKQVLQEAVDGGMSLEDAQNKLNGAFRVSTDEIGGLTGSMDRWQQSLESAVGIAKSPGLQDMQNFVKDWVKNHDLPPITIGGVPITNAQPGQGPIPAGPLRQFLPEAPAPALSQDQITELTLGAYARRAGAGQDIAGQVAPYVDLLGKFLPAVNEAIAQGTKLPKVLDTVRRAAQLGVIDWQDYVAIMKDFGRSLPFQQAGAFQHALLQSPLVTAKLAKETIGLNKAMEGLGIKLDKGQQGYANYLLEQGNSLEGDKTFATYIRGPLKHALEAHWDDLSKTERKTANAWKEDGKWVAILKHLKGWIDEVKGKHTSELKFKVTGAEDLRQFVQGHGDKAGLGAFLRQKGANLYDVTGKDAGVIKPKFDDTDLQRGMSHFTRFVSDQKPKMKVDADTDPAQTSIDNFVKSQHQKIYIDVITRYDTKGHPPRGGGSTTTTTTHHGGGPGGLTQPHRPVTTTHFGTMWGDEGMHMLQGGEVVTARDKAARYRPLLSAIHHDDLGRLTPHLRSRASQREGLSRQDIQALASAVERAVSRVTQGGDVYLDGYKVGKVIEGRARRAARR